MFLCNFLDPVDALLVELIVLLKKELNITKNAKLLIRVDGDDSQPLFTKTKNIIPPQDSDDQNTQM